MTESKTTWQPIETCPNNFVLLAHTNGRMVIGYHNHDGEFCDNDSIFTGEQFTHWMPLPEKPNDVTFEDCLIAKLAMELACQLKQ